MRLGAIFPQTEIGTDPITIRDFAQAIEAFGYDHLVVYDHVLGADVSSRSQWLGYTLADMFHEPFVLFGYLAGCTRRIELVTGILILPQRQTALVAKQAAELDVLSGGGGGAAGGGGGGSGGGGGGRGGVCKHGGG